MKSRKPAAGREEIVSIRDASDMLGVSEVTLRQWTDEGKLKAFITPGGHRRYFKSELIKITRSSQRVLGVKDLAVEMEDTILLHRDIARSFLERYAGQSRPDEQRLHHLAYLGRNLLGLIVRYVGEPSKRDLIITAAKEIGADFGKDLAEMGLPLTDSVEAFISHREPFIGAATLLMGKRGRVKGRVIEAIPLANRFIDETLLAMIAAHQRYSGGAKGDLP